MAFDHEFRGLAPAPECLVDDCKQPAFGRKGEFCPGHKDEESYECDACGEVKHTEGGEDYRIGTVHAASIDPPEDIWVCRDCLAQQEDAEISRAEDRADNQDLYFYEK